MRKHVVLLLLLLFIGPRSAWADPVTVDKARGIAEDFFRSFSPTLARSAISMKLIYQPALTRSVGSEAEYYVFAPEIAGGFVIVSGDDALTPVLGYSPSGAIDEGRIPDALMAWLGDYARYVRDVRSGSAKAYRRVISSLLRSTGEAVGPLLVAQWDQGRPFNDLCPVIDNEKTPAGCVATAMAQVMKFYNWPDRGEGRKTFAGDHGEETIDFSKSVYDWKNMRDKYTCSWGGNGALLPDYTEKEAEAVSRLMYEVGRSVNMNYAPSGSGAIARCAAAALVDYFKYSPRVRYYCRDMYTTDDWIELIRRNLCLRQPMLYSASGMGGAHCFVCDGIDSSDFVHINWGWGGNYDGYFDMGHLAPSGTGIGGGSGSYFENQSVVAEIHPRVEGETAVPASGLLAQDICVVGDTSFPVREGEEYTFKGIVPKLYNASGRQLDAQVGFCIKRNGVWQSTGSTKSLSFTYHTNYRNVRFEIAVTTDPNMGSSCLTPGSYEIVLCRKLVGQKEWVPVESGSGANGVIIELTGSEITIRLDKELEPARLSLVSVTPPAGDLYVNMMHNITFSLRNTGSVLPQSEVFYAFIPQDKIGNLTDQEIRECVKGSSVPCVYGNTRMEVYLKCQVATAGKYRVRLYSKDSPTSAFVPIPEDSPQYLMFVSLPENPVPLLTRPLSMQRVLEQGASVFIMYNAWMRGTGLATSMYTGKLALYAARKGDTSGGEYKLLEHEIRVTEQGGYLMNTSGYTPVTKYMEPGEYVAYLKYDAGGGMMVKVAPDDFNFSTFELKASPEFETLPDYSMGSVRPMPEDCALISRPDGFLLKGVKGGSSVHVSALDGRVLYKGTASGEEMLIPLSGKATGLYIVTVTAPGGETNTFKRIRR